MCSAALLEKVAQAIEDAADRSDTAHDTARVILAVIRDAFDKPSPEMILAAVRGFDGEVPMRDAIRAAARVVLGEGK